MEIDRAIQSRRANDCGRTLDVDRCHRLGRGNTGVRGTVLVFVTAAAPASRATDLRDVANDSAKYHRLLPGSSARRYPEPRAPAAFPPFTNGRLSAAAQRQITRAAAADRAYPIADNEL